MSARILIVEDDADLAEILRVTLADAGYEPSVENHGGRALAAVQSEPPDLVILDLMLPGKDGLEICRQLRQDRLHLPVLMLTARTSESDRVLGLEVGADEYLPKPVGMRELVARVRAMLRRVGEYGEQNGAATNADDKLSFGSLEVNPQMRKVCIDGAEISLTAKEFDLLHYLARNPGRVFTRRDLLDEVWGYGYEGYEHTVNSHINRLRAKIEANPDEPSWILTVWGVGYKFPERPSA